MKLLELPNRQKSTSLTRSNPRKDVAASGPSLSSLREERRLASPGVITPIKGNYQDGALTKLDLDTVSKKYEKI